MSEENKVNFSTVDVQNMVADLQRLRKENGDLRMMMKGHIPPSFTEEMDALRAERDALKKALDCADTVIGMCDSPPANDPWRYAEHGAAWDKYALARTELNQLQRK